MGWNQGVEVFDRVVGFILAQSLDRIDSEMKVRLIEVVIEALEEADWDTLEETAYWGNRYVRAVMERVHPELFEEVGDATEEGQQQEDGE